MTALDFVTVDFETANGSKEPACAVGVASRASGVEAPFAPFRCTLQLSRGHLDLVDRKLPTVVRHLSLDNFPHHRAESDALAAAQVTVEPARRAGATPVA